MFVFVVRLQGDFRTALDIYDQQVGRRAKRDKHAFVVSDAVSLLYRLKLEGKACVPRVQLHVRPRSSCFEQPHCKVFALFTWSPEW